MAKNFQHEKMRKELKLRISDLRHFLDEKSYEIDGIQRGDLTTIFNNVYDKYSDLIKYIEQKIENMGYPYDEREFRIKLKKLSLFINKVLENTPSDEKYSLFKSDIVTVKEMVSEQVLILESYFKKDCYFTGEPTLDD